MKMFEILFDRFKEECELSIFDELIKTDKKSFVNMVLNLIKQNIEVNSEKCLIENVSLLTIVYQIYPFDDYEIEKKISINLVENYIFFSMKNISEYNDIKNQFLVLKNLNLFIDIFFHNPSFVDFLDDSQKNNFIKSMMLIIFLKYNENNKKTLQLILEYSISIFLNFPYKIIEKYKHLYLNHFDKRIVNEFLESY